VDVSEDEDGVNVWAQLRTLTLTHTLTHPHPHTHPLTRRGDLNLWEGEQTYNMWCNNQELQGSERNLRRGTALGPPTTEYQ
jgi:hypothetical protein